MIVIDEQYFVPCVCVCVGMYVLTRMYMVYRRTEFHTSSCSGPFDTAIEANTWSVFALTSDGKGDTVDAGFILPNQCI